MLGSLLQFELRFHTRQYAFFMGLFAFGFFGFFMTGQMGLAGKLNVNSPHLITSVYLFLGLMTPILTGVLAANGVLRDEVNRSAEMVYASQLTAGKYIITRYLGIVIIGVLCLGMAAVTMMLRTYIPGGIDGNFVQNTPWHYGWVLLVFILPSIMLCAAISFATACFSRNVLATYLSGLMIYVVYFITSIYVGSPLFGDAMPAEPQTKLLAALIDPFGLSAFEVQTEFWTPLERNSQVVPLSGSVLLNRAIWIGVTLVIMLGVYARFKLDLNHKTSGKKPKGSEVKAMTFGNTTSTLPIKTPTINLADQWSVLSSCIRLEVSYLLKSYVFWGVVILWSILLAGEIVPLTFIHDFDSPRYPTTSRVLERFQYDLLPRFSLFVLAFYCADMVWREKNLQMSAFTDASPARSMVFFVSKFLSLALIPLFLITIAVLIGVVVQISVGYYQFEPSLYLSLYYYGGLPLLMSIMLCLFVQVLAPNKAIGMVVSAVLLLLFSTNLSGRIGFEHGLWHFASAGDFRYSDMNGYAHISHTFATYMFYWGFLSVLMALVGFGLWRRGADISLRTRLSQIKPQIGKMGMAIGAACLIGFVSTGSYIFYQTNVVANYFTSEEAELWRVDYEQQFKRFLSVPQPQIQRVKTDVALYPKQRRYEVTGQYSLINRQNVAVNEFLVSLDKDINVLELTVPGSELEAHAEFGVYHVKFKQPLAPGKTVQLTFKLQQQQSGFGQFSSSELVTDNATMLYAGNRFPVIGYIKQMELGNDKRRKAHGLSAQELPQTLEQSLKNKLETTRPFVEFESIVSTTAEQTAIANGTLQRQWVEGERAYFHYKTDAPIRNEQVYLSAEYEIAKSKAQGIDIAVYYHRAHGVNVPRMLSAIADSLAYQVSQFGPYPHKQFKQVETAAYTRFTGLAVPSMTLISEHAGFTYDLRDDDLQNGEALDQVYRRGAHEAAHQWWAHKLAPAKADQGANILTETLARYSESMIMKKVYGEQVALNFIEYEMGRYFRGRARERNEELPLYRAQTDQQYLLYSKGAVAMYALQHQIGEARINRALKQLVEQFAYPNTPPTSLDLVTLLYQEAPEHKGLIDHWFKDIITVENRLTSAEYKLLDDGRYEVELAIKFSEFRAAPTGEDVLIDSRLNLEIEVMFEHGSIVQKVEVKSGENKVRLVVEQLPVSVKLDPNRLMLNKVWLQGERIVVGTSGGSDER